MHIDNRIYLNGEATPAASKFKDTVARLDASSTQDMMNLSQLCSFQIPRAGPYL
jgi:hypothetical protein